MNHYDDRYEEGCYEDETYEYDEADYEREYDVSYEEYQEERYTDY